MRQHLEMLHLWNVRRVVVHRTPNLPTTLIRWHTFYQPSAHECQYRRCGVILLIHAYRSCLSGCGSNGIQCADTTGVSPLRGPLRRVLLFGAVRTCVSVRRTSH